MQNSNCQICVKRYFLETHPTHPATALAHCPCEKVCRHVHQDWEGRERVQESTRISLGLGRVGCVHNTCCLREQQWRGWNFLTFLTWKFHIDFFESELICLVCTWRKTLWTILLGGFFFHGCLANIKTFPPVQITSKKRFGLDKLSISRKLID